MGNLSVSEMTITEAEQYFDSIGSLPSCMKEHPYRRKRWEFMTEGLDKSLAEEYRAIDRRVRGPQEVDYLRRQTEILLENELIRICLEDLKDRRMLTKTPEEIFEEIDSTAVAPFTKWSLPIIRRVVPRTYARSLVNLQAMPQADGKIFYIDTKYGTSKAPTTAGQRVDLVANFNHKYAGGKYTMEITATATDTFDLADAGTSGHVVFVDGVENVDWTIGAGAGTGGVDEIVFDSAMTGGEEITITYDNYQEGAVARDIDITMESSSITAETWALRGVMTVQTLQDFQATHGISGEGELTSALASEIDREIDFTILDRLRREATGGNTNWDAAGFLPGDTSTTFRRDYQKTLYEALIATGNLIYVKRFLNPTWIVGGVSAIERLEKLEDFKWSSTPSAPDDGAVERIYEGTLQGRYQVYKDARFPSNTLLMGYKGASPFHSAATFAPYVPAYMTDLLPDPSINFKVRKGLMSRNGFKITIPEAFGTVTIV